MIRFPLNNPKPPIHLLQQYHSHELVGEGHGGEGQFVVSPLQHLIAEA